MEDYIIKAENVNKRYGDFLALDNFSCEIPTGVTGLLGPNGAGKTTFIRSLLGVHEFDSGVIHFADYTLPNDINIARDHIGYQPELPTKIRSTTAMKYVSHMSKMAGLSGEASKQRAFDTLHYVGLEEARYREMDDFSQGMLQKVKLATALVHDPLLMILDEPTAGCDPQSRDQILKLIEDLGKNYNKNILISTHILNDIEKTANYVVVMNNGQNVIQGDLNTVMQSEDSQTLQVRISGDHYEFADILENNGFDVMSIDQFVMSCRKSGNGVIKEIFKLADNEGHHVLMATPYRQSLEEVFLDVVGKEEESN